MEHGDIVEKGTHEQLIAAQGAYYRLYRSQFEQAHDDLVDAPADVDAAPAEGKAATE